MNPVVYLVGEHNPYGSNPRMALFPAPRTSAGGRLCRWILGMPRAEYLAAFERRNLITDAARRPKWSVVKARAAAHSMVRDASLGLTLHEVRVVALGARVAAAFTSEATKWEAVQVQYVEHDTVLWRARVLYLPHPSGQCREWNDPEAIERARAAVRGLAPHLAPLLGSSP